MNINQLNIEGITFIRYTAPCSNFCKFCSVGTKWFDNVPFDTFASIVRRFVRWSAESPSNPPVSAAMQYTHAYLSYERSKEFLNLCPPGKYGPLPLQMNGCRFMPDDELYELFERHFRAGYSKYSITVCGDRGLHDRWVGRSGEFDSFRRMAVIAADLGYTRVENVFLSRSSIGCMESVIRTLDSFPGKFERSISPFMYIGNARNLESERITRKDLVLLPDSAKPYINWDAESAPCHSIFGYRTEGEWIHSYADGHRSSESEHRYLLIRVDEKNARLLSTGSCSDIYLEYKNRYISVYEKIPEFYELSRIYGQPENRRLYLDFELERKWAEQYIRDNLWDKREDYAISSF